MLNAIRKNSLSLMLSTVAIAGYGAWISVPESTSIQSIYDRYIAREESRPRIFDEGIAIRLNREAPPVAALEEALRDQPWTSIERSPGFNVRPIELRPQAGAPERTAIRILSENEKFNRAIATQLAEQPSAPTIYVPDITTPIAPPTRLPSERMRAEAPNGRRGVSYVAGMPAAVSSARRLESLSLPAATEPTAPAATPTRVISISKTGLSREQILASLFGPMSQTQGSANIGRAAAPSVSTKADKLIAQNAESSKPADVVEDYSSIASRAMGMVAPVGRQVTIRGTIELSGGLALTHAHDRIAVLRESRGQFVESGAVWIREARYEIFVESLEGQLVAEVRSPQGDVIGRGQLALSTLGLGDNQKSLDGVALRVTPVAAGIAGRVQSAYNAGNGARATSQGVQGAKVQFLNTNSVVKSVAGGHFEEPRFTDGSRVVAQINSKEHWPTLANLTSGQEPTVPIFSQKMMNAFVNLTAPDSSAVDSIIKTKGVIWGRVSRSGQAVAGADVSVLTQGAGEPVYFNDLMIPDFSLKATGSNGLFAVPAVNQGAHAVQIKIGKRLSDPVFMRAEPHMVSSVDLDVMKASDVPARAFDAFRVEVPVRTEVRPAGHIRGRRMIVQGDEGSTLKLANLGMPSVLEIDGGVEYLMTRTIQNPETRMMQIPMVTRAWFDRQVGRVRYNNQPQTGNVIGFIQGARFRVSMDEAALSSGAKVLYFNAGGEVTTREYGEAGGGFILLGVKNGLQTVIVEAESRDRVYAGTVLVEDGIVASLSHWMR